MHQLVVVRNGPDGQFTAQVAGVTDLQVTGTSREEVVQRIRELLHERIASGELVAIELAGENPWLKYAGWAKDDPYYHIYLEELAKAKKEDLERTLKEYEQECPNSSSTPTT